MTRPGGVAPRFDTTRCKRCGLCSWLCPAEAIRAGEGGTPYFDSAGACSGCRMCELICPDFAVTLVQAGVEAVAPTADGVDWDRPVSESRVATEERGIMGRAAEAKPEEGNRVGVQTLERPAKTTARRVTEAAEATWEMPAPVGQDFGAGPLADREFIEVRFGGSGGQGVILTGIVLAMAATRDHRHVVNTQSYGPEARGGYSRSDVIIAAEPVSYPELQAVDLLVALSPEAAERYCGLLNRDSYFVYDSGLIPEPPQVAGRMFGAPFTQLATEVSGRPQTANILALSAAVAVTGVVTPRSLEVAALSMVPESSVEPNMRALACGMGFRGYDWGE